MKANLLLRPFRIFAAILVIVSLELPAPAELYVYEGFNYTGNLIPPGGGNGQGTGLGWNGTWFTDLVVGGFPIDPSSLHPPTAAIARTGGNIRQPLLPSHAYHARRLLTPLTIDHGADLWVSAAMATSAETLTMNSVQFFFNPYGAAEGANVFFGTFNSSSPTRWVVGAGPIVFGPEITASVPALLVAKIHRDAVTDEFTFKFWVNPGSTCSPSGEPTDLPVTTQTRFGFFTTLYYVVLNTYNQSAGASLHQMDEIRIGSTYADINLSPPPTLTCPDAVAVQCDADVPLPAADKAAFLTAGGTVSGGTAPVTVSFTSDVPGGSCPKTITRTYTATDACSRTATCTQTITVHDTEAPVINPGTVGADATIDCPNTPSFTPPTATDNCDASPQVVEDSDNTIPGACAGAYVRTKIWHAVDACGLVSAPVSQTITAIDTTPPTMVCPENKLIVTGPGPVSFTATATDACDSSPTISYDPPSGTTFPLGVTAVKCKARDSCGNESAECSFTVTVAQPCPPGYFSANGASPCVPAPPGYYVALSGALSPTPSPVGHYVPGFASTAPTLAPVGTYCPIQSMRAPLTVPAGYYAPGPGDSAIIPAPAGSFAPAGAAAPTLAPAGEYAPVAGMATSVPVPAGYYAPVGTAVPTPAPAGSYAPAGSSAPILAPAGSYAPIAGMTSSLTAPAGYYAPGSGNTAVIAAPAGSYAPAGSSAPILAPAGEYAPIAGMASSVLAPAGYYAPEGTVIPIPAPVGSFAPEGSSAPISTPPGSYTPISGMASSILASPGYFVASAGASAMTPAAPGSFIPATGATAAITPPAGKYAPVAGMQAAISPGDGDNDGAVTQSELNVILTNYWLNSPWLEIKGVTKLGDGLFGFVLTNSTGWDFSVQVSTDVNGSIWEDLGVAHPVYQFQDPAAGNGAPQRSYRLRWP